MSDRRRRERGSALTPVLILMILLEVAVLTAASQVVRVSQAVRVTTGGAIAERLAGSALAHAEALYTAQPNFRGEVTGSLAEGRYWFSILEAPDGDTGVAVVAVGQRTDGRSVRLSERLWLADARLHRSHAERQSGHSQFEVVRTRSKIPRRLSETGHLDGHRSAGAP